MKYNRDNWPESWRIPAELDGKFVPERWEDYPKGGFLEDVVLYQKGYETTNFLSFWAGVHYVSSMIMRDAELVWAHGGMYPNFYTLMVAPPGLVKKSTTIHGLEKVEMQAQSLFTNAVQRFRKAGVVIRGKATPEAIFASLANEKMTIEIGEDDNGDKIFHEEDKNANLIIRVSELSTFVNGSKYNVALIDKLTDFYDCKDTDSDTTIGRGNLELKNVFCTLMGATTPDTLATTIPKEAFGGGFVSRSLILKEDYTERIFPEPIAWPGLPSTDELAERLAWIGYYKKGKFALSPEAYDVYAKWYTKNKLALRASVLAGETEHENNRKDIHVLKLAHILCIQRYDITNVISLEDIQNAMRIIEYTIAKAHEVLKETSISPAVKNIRYIEKFLARRKKITRKALISAVYHKGIDTTLLSSILEDLKQAEKITITTEGGGNRSSPSRNAMEVYEWLGE